MIDDNSLQMTSNTVYGHPNDPPEANQIVVDSQNDMPVNNLSTFEYQNDLLAINDRIYDNHNSMQLNNLITNQHQINLPTVDNGVELYDNHNNLITNEHQINLPMVDDGVYEHRFGHQESDDDVFGPPIAPTVSDDNSSHSVVYIEYGESHDAVEEDTPPPPLHDDEAIIIVLDAHRVQHNTNMISMNELAVENPITRLENPHYQPEGAECAVDECEEKPSRKRDYDAMIKDANDMDGQVCPVCLEFWTDTGNHRLCSLSCGHFFGSSCIQRWLTHKKTCPQCNKPVKAKSLRNHFASKVMVVDSHEVNELQKEVNQLKKKNVDLMSELKKCRGQVAVLEKQKLASEERRQMDDKKHTPAPFWSRLFLEKVLLIPEGGCRVCAFSSQPNMLVLSYKNSNALFPGFGIRKIREVGLEYSQNNFSLVHQLAVRDMSFHRTIPYLLLTVSLDKTAKILDLSDNQVLLTCKTDKPLWSCCWDLQDTNLFYAGSGSGSVMVFNKTLQGQPITVVEGNPDKSAVIALTALPYQGAAFRGGVICCRLNSLTVYEHVLGSPVTGTRLDITGPFFSFSYDPNTRHFLVSCRPCAETPMVRHVYCELVFSESQPTCRQVHVFMGGDRQTLLSRSCMVSINRDCLVAAYEQSVGGIALWSTATGNKLQTIKSSDAVIDIAAITVGSQRQMIAALSEKHVRFYELRGTSVVG